ITAAALPAARSAASGPGPGVPARVPESDRGSVPEEARVADPAWAAARPRSGCGWDRCSRLDPGRLRDLLEYLARLLRLRLLGDREPRLRRARLRCHRVSNLLCHSSHLRWLDYPRGSAAKRSGPLRAALLANHYACRLSALPRQPEVLRAVAGLPVSLLRVG